MKVVAVINYKGGVGKTTLTANLGAELAWRGHRVLMLDLDPQASLTFSFIQPDDWEANFATSGTIKSWFDSFELGRPSELASLIHTPQRAAARLHGKGRLDLIPSHLALINVDLELATKLGGSTLAQAKRNFLQVHRRLADGLADVAHGEYDVVLIDCPPNFNIVTKTALIASDYILVPARPDNLSTLGIDYLIRSVGGLVREYNEFAEVAQGEEAASIDPKVLGVVFTMIQEYGGGPMAAHRLFINRIRAREDIAVFESYIKRNDSIFAEAPVYGVPVAIQRYTSSAQTHASVVDGLERVTDEFVDAVGLPEAVGA